MENISTLALDELALKTINLSSILKNEPEFLQLYLFDEDSSRKKDISVNNHTQKNTDAGLICRILKGSNTFTIRTFYSDQLKHDYQQFLQVNHLKITDKKVQQEMFIFPVDVESLASKIMQQFANRRFLLDESQVFNLSDPAPSYWMHYDQCSLEIFFHSCLNHKNKEFICLGPVGDKAEFRQGLQDCFSFFNTLMNVKRLSLSERNFKLEVDDSSRSDFGCLIKLFLAGDNEILQMPRELDCSQHDFLYAFSLYRKFWNEVTQRTLIIQ